MFDLTAEKPFFITAAKQLFFIFLLISLTSLVSMCKIQKNFYYNIPANIYKKKVYKGVSF